MGAPDLASRMHTNFDLALIEDCDSSDDGPETPMQGPEEKGDFFGAWGGISSVGLGLPILWTEGLKRDENFSVEEIVR